MSAVTENMDVANGTIENNSEQEMSGCPRFKQNAWKKELCSNCYRPKEEHKSKKSQRNEPPIVILKPAAQGILSLGSKKHNKKKKKCVRFTKEESEVIGYGGLEASDSEDDDDFEFERSEQPAPMEREVPGEEEKALERLTKNNTDYNSSLKNLSTAGEPPKAAPPSTQLGKQQKQTLQVTVQPFSSTSIAASRKSHLNKLLEDEDPKPAIISGSPKEIVKNSSVKDMDEKDEVKLNQKDNSKILPEPKNLEEDQTMPSIKTIVIEPKKEERGTPEGRKTHIQRGSIVTKAHEQAKNKLCVQNVQKNDKRNSLDDKYEDNEDVQTIIITGLSVEEKNEKNLQESIKDDIVEVEPTKVKIETEEVTVKVLKLLNGKNGPPESREMAGEPDGKADSDEHEQETPITPPPRSSFLHREMNSPEKPPKPAIYSSTTDLKSKSIYQTPSPDVKSPARPTSLLNLTTSDVKPLKESPSTILSGSSPDFKKAPLLNGFSPELKTPPGVNGLTPDAQIPSIVNRSSLDVKKTSIVNGSSSDLGKTSLLNGSSTDLKKASMLNGSSTDLKKASVLNGSSTDLKMASMPNGSSNDVKKTVINGSPPEPKKTSIFHGSLHKKPPKTSPLNGLTDVIVSQGPAPQSPSSPDGKPPKLVFVPEVKTSKAASMFNSLSSEIKSFKSFLSSPTESKHKSLPGTLPPTPLTLARSISPPPALPTTPPPVAPPSPSSVSAPSPSISLTSSSTLSSKQPASPSSSPPSSLGANSMPPLPTTPPPQPTGLAPQLILNGATAPVSLPALAPLQINTHLHSPLTPSDDVPVLQEVCFRKRPAPKPPMDTPPEPLPRRRNSSEANSSGTGTEKKKTRVRQTLRKLLRFGSREEEPSKHEDDPPAIPRPRPQIIHPLDLNKSAVQVLPPHSVVEKSSPDSASNSNSSSRPSKPPPPPRSESLNLMERLRPRDSPSSNGGDNVYANLGEGRCGITPVKPQRTGSMRDALPSKPASHQSDVTPSKTPAYQNDFTPSKSAPYANDATKTSKVITYQSDNDHVYECVGVSSIPEKQMKHKPLPQTPNSSSGSPSSGSDEEIYYPYVTFQNGECKTVMKKRGVVTQSLEENYGAVVIANFEALTHLLHQVSERKPEVPPVIQAATNVSWSSFELVEGAKPLVLNSFSFIDGSMGDIEVTLAVAGGGKNFPSGLEIWCSFLDAVPESLGINCNLDQKEVAVFKRSKIEKFVTFAKKLEKTVDSVREGVLLLLHILKYMTTEVPTAVDSNSFIVLSSISPLQRHKAFYLPPEGEESTSCQDAAVFLSQELLGDLALGKVLSKCRLEEMSNVLEVWLWGPASSLPLQAIKRWLDLERANLLQSLVRATPSEDLDLLHLSFLVHTSASSIMDANEIIHS